ncbi:MAG: hypothetical protein JSS23_12325 [Proteobacteria bacterium]|nr:hypothetical protein [Pseudomonadota bacterium]
MYNDQIDDPLQPAGTLSFIGVREGLTPSLLDDNLCTHATDIVFDTSARCNSRPGTSWVARPQAAAVQGQWYYDIPGFERLLVVSNGKLYHLSAVGINSTATEITGITPALSTTHAVVFSQLVDTVYFADGSNYYSIKWDGVAWVIANIPNFSGGSPLADFTILLTCAVGGASFRVIASGVNTTDNDLLYVSNPLDGATFNSANNVRVGKGDGDPIRGVVSGQAGQMFVAKENSVWVVSPVSATLADWEIRAITEDLGCVAGATMRMVGQDVLMLTPRGVVSLARLQQSDTVNEAVFISSDIKRTIARINWEHAGTAHAFAWDDFYLVAVPLDDATTPNAILAYNTISGRWSGYWTGLQPRCAVETRFAGRRDTVMGDNEGKLLRINPDVSRDQTSLGTYAAIASVMETKAWNFGAPENWKQLFTVAVQFEEATGTVDVELICDGRAAAMIEEDARTNQLPQLPVQLPVSLAADTHLRRSWHIRTQPRTREVRLRLTSTGGILRVREIRFQAWLDTVEVLR